MAEFCLECWNKMNETDENEKKYITSKELDLCEGCGEWKHVIIMERKAYYMRKFKLFFWPFIIIWICEFTISENTNKNTTQNIVYPRDKLSMKSAKPMKSLRDEMFA